MYVKYRFFWTGTWTMTAMVHQLLQGRSSSDHTLVTKFRSRHQFSDLESTKYQAQTSHKLNMQQHRHSNLKYTVRHQLHSRVTVQGTDRSIIILSFHEGSAHMWIMSICSKYLQIFCFSQVFATPSGGASAVRHHSLSHIPDLSKCVLIPDDSGVHKSHPILQRNMRQVKALVGAPMNIPVTSTAPSAFQASTSLGSTGSSLFGSSTSTVGSVQGQVGGSALYGSRWSTKYSLVKKPTYVVASWMKDGKFFSGSD